MPPVKNLWTSSKHQEVKIWACKLAMDMFHYTTEDLYEELDNVLTVGDFYTRAMVLVHKSFYLTKLLHHWLCKRAKVNDVPFGSLKLQGKITFYLVPLS